MAEIVFAHAYDIVEACYNININSPVEYYLSTSLRSN